jgi:hypothetical protein
VLPLHYTSVFAFAKLLYHRFLKMQVFFGGNFIVF